MSIFKDLKNKVKEIQKERSIIIRAKRSARKPIEFEANSKYYQSLPSMYSIYWDYRHTHIAYCTFFNNTPYDDIEKPIIADAPNMKIVDSLINEWKEKLEVGGDEVICLSA